jgi:hypothetical protein
MEYKPPTLALLAGLGLAAAFSAPLSVAAGQPDAGAASANEAAADSAAADAARAAFHHRSISAKIRQRIDLFGQQLSGTGNYMQLGSGNDKLLRWELKIGAGEKVTSMQQVCDGRFLWDRRDLPEGPSLGRVDLKKYHAALAASSAAPPVDRQAAWLGLGGLSKLLSGLAANFHFTPPRADQLGDVPVWVAYGTWRAERLAEQLPEQGEAIRAGRDIHWNKAPENLPASVLVVLGRDDLFPYRVEYRRPAPRARAGEGGSVEKPIVTMELFEVRLGAPLDPLLFVYQPDNLEVADFTDAYLRRLGLAKDDDANAGDRSAGGPRHGKGQGPRR